MSILGWLTAGPQAAEKVLDSTIKGIDALVYTDEEKAVARQKFVDSWLDLQKIMGEETTVRAVTRRILAILVVFPFVVIASAAAIAYPFNEKYADFLLDVADGQFGTMSLMVAGFYFGPYMIGQVMQALKKPAALQSTPPVANGNGNGNGNGNSNPMKVPAY